MPLLGTPESDTFMPVRVRKSKFINVGGRITAIRHGFQRFPKHMEVLETARKACEYLTGLSEEEAIQVIEATKIEDSLDRADNLTWRVLLRDGHAMIKTNDYKPWRINLYIENGVVLRANPG